MDVAILAGGAGRRLRPLTYWTPKPLFPVPGGTLLDRLLHQIEPLRPRTVYVVVRHLADKLIAHLAGARPVHVLQQGKPYTPLGALATVEQAAQGPILILHGDNCFSALPVEAIKSAPSSSATFFVETVPDDTASAATLAATGCYVLNREALQTAATIQDADNLAVLTHAILASGDHLHARPLDAWRYNINSVQEYLSLQDRVWEDPDGHLLPSSSNGGNTVWVSGSATVEHAVLGPRVTLAPGACVRHSYLSDTVILAGATVENTRLHRAVVGPGPTGCTVLMFGGKDECASNHAEAPGERRGAAE